MTRQTVLEFLYDGNGKIRSGRSITKSLRMDYGYYSKWFDNPANANKIIKVGNNYHYPGVQFASYKEFNHSTSFKQTANALAYDYCSARMNEIDRNTGMSIWVGIYTNSKNITHDDYWVVGNKFIRRITRLLKQKGMK
jgi:hypothetical protein